MSDKTVVRDLNAGLARCFQTDPSVILWGEDVLDPYGGAFKVTAGLSTEFPGRVFCTPISEAAIVGMGVGAAMRGLRPIVEIMFGDFILLAADQLVNHAAKFSGMYNGQVTVPLVVRVPMGGGRGYGPTHSQTLEKHLLGVPGLRVVAATHFISPGELLENAVLNDPMPVLFIENKVLYPTSIPESGENGLEIERISGNGSIYPWVHVWNYDKQVSRSDVTVACYGGISRLLEGSLPQLADEEIWVDAFLPTELCGEFPRFLEDSCRRTQRVLLIEESTPGFGWTSEMARGIAERICATTTITLKTLTAAESVIPSERSMENEMLPSVDGITKAVMEILA